MLLAGLGSVCIVTNCVLGLENAALGHSFSLYGSQPANNIYLKHSARANPNLFLLGHHEPVQFQFICKISVEFSTSSFCLNFGHVKIIGNNPKSTSSL